MSGFPAYLRLAFLAPLLVVAGCNDVRSTPSRNSDGGRDRPRDQAPGESSSLEVTPAYDAGSPIDTPYDAPGLRPPATRDAPASEARSPTPIPDAGYVFVEDFSSTVTTEWQALDMQGSTINPGVWSVVLGDSGSVLTQGKLDMDTWHIAYADTELGRDQIVEARLRVLDFYAESPSCSAALLGRYDPRYDSGYFVALRADGSVTLRKRENGTSAAWGGSTEQGFRAGVWYTVRLEIVGAAITAFIDGVEVYHVTDESPLTGGHVGLGAFGTTLEVDRIFAAEPLADPES
jgi:hypothetical protein